MKSKASIYILPNCPDFLAEALTDAVTEGLTPRPLNPGEPDPRDYPDDFGAYWEACKEGRKAGRA